jgi:putative transposase
MRKWRESPGYGKALTEAQTRLRWPRSLSGQTRQTGEKMGTKRSVLVDGRGVPLSVVVSGANTHDSRLLGATLDQSRLDPPNEGNNLCLDAGYVGKADDVIERNMIPHIRPRSEERKRGRGRKKARRWVVERVFSWLNQFRKIKTRYEKLDVSHMGLLSLCCGMIAWRQVIVIYG